MAFKRILVFFGDEAHYFIFYGHDLSLFGKCMSWSYTKKGQLHAALKVLLSMIDE